MKKIDYKVEGGKFLRIQADIKSGMIRDIKIRGDFFIYPETAIFEIEDLLKGQEVENIIPIFSSYIRKEDIKIIGFSASDLKTALLSNM